MINIIITGILRNAAEKDMLASLPRLLWKEPGWGGGRRGPQGGQLIGIVLMLVLDASESLEE